MKHRLLFFTLLLALPFATWGCTTLQQLANLRNVDFALDRLTEPTLAGINLQGKQTYGDFGPLDALKLARAFERNELPLSFTLHVLAENPEANAVQARLVQMDWTLFLEDRETVSGTFNDDIALPPGTAVGIPISMELDLLRFFNNNLSDLADLVLNLYGAGGEPKKVTLRARPTIQTPIGPIQYPDYITIVNQNVGR